MEEMSAVGRSVGRRLVKIHGDYAVKRHARSTKKSPTETISEKSTYVPLTAQQIDKQSICTTEGAVSKRQTPS